jgi:hypothetical protein
MTGSVVFVALIVMVALGVVAWLGLSRFWSVRGKRLVRCPETGKPSIVQIDARLAAVTALFSGTDFRIERCSRWPNRQGCPQACLEQIADAPEGCLVRKLLESWYAEHSCALCRRPFGTLSWLRPPALMTADRVTRTWPELANERLADTLATHLPVCWNCHIAETFRRVHPELVIDAPAKPARPDVSGGRASLSRQ